MVVRNGDVLSRLGKMAELFDDHSPLQLLATGSWNQRAFTLVGRLQYKYAQGTWTEWQLLFANGDHALLSEDNGAYVLMQGLQAQAPIAAPAMYRVGRTTAINGKSFSVASNESVALLSAQGELPKLPALGQAFSMVDLRAADGEVVSIDFSSHPPALYSGRSVALELLGLQGLRDESVRPETGRQLSCPNCGAQVRLALPDSKSVSCSACNCIIDLTQGVGSELRHALQDEPVKPLIALGKTGQLQGTDWQVVGYQHRMGQDPGDPDEQFGWEEYLLFNRKRGFAFLVDASDGWSMVRPATGAPVVSNNGQNATYLGTRYQLKESYNAETNYVAGEFYWQVQRGQRSSNRDYSNGRNILSMEQSPNELTWSVGSAIESDAVAKAFGLEGSRDLLKRSDVSPVSAAKGMGLAAVVTILLFVILLLFLLGRCSACDPALEDCATSYGSRSAGGAYGGYSGGGGHK